MLTKNDRKARYKAIEAVFKARVANLRKIAQAYDTWADFGRVIEKDAAFCTQIIGPNPSRTIGEKLARDLEFMLGLETGSLDKTA